MQDTKKNSTMLSGNSDMFIMFVLLSSVSHRITNKLAQSQNSIVERRLRTAQQYMHRDILPRTAPVHAPKYEPMSQRNGIAEAKKPNKS
jgi:hypothetical protein